jgi:aromatic ring-cleaving dioxygenase
MPKKMPAKKAPKKMTAKKNTAKKKAAKKNKPQKTTGAVATNDPRSITEYHAHVYYEARNTRDRAERLRQRVAAEFPSAKLGRWHDELVGPHPQSMYQIAFPSGMLASLLPWLMLNRDGLTILLHPETGNDYRDHTVHAAWLGAALPLRLDVLSAQHTDE